MDIKCTQNIFKSANGSSNISYYILRPEGTNIRGIIQISHGMCEYFSRYTSFAKYLCSFGFIVCGNDHLGHGNSVSRTSDLGYFAMKDGCKALIEDLSKLTDIMKDRYPDLPYFLLGHSMGSLIARLYAAKYSDKLDGLIICGTSGPLPANNIGIRVANSVIHTKGPMYRSSMLNKFTFGNYLKKIENAETSFDWLTHDKDIISLYQSDEKCNFIFTSSGFRDLYRLNLHANNLKTFKSTINTLPILLIAGDMDPVGAYGDGVRRVATLYKSVGTRDLELILYKDGRHEILNEQNKLEIYGDILKWIEQHIPEGLQ